MIDTLNVNEVTNEIKIIFQNQNDDSDSPAPSSSQATKDVSEVVKKLERAGPCSDRLAAMKAAFRSQYNTQVMSWKLQVDLF